jgi:hypothetical protein
MIIVNGIAYQYTGIVWKETTNINGQITTKTVDRSIVVCAYSAIDKRNAAAKIAQIEGK